jgi:hypothetical protein
MKIEDVYDGQRVEVRYKGDYREGYIRYSGSITEIVMSTEAGSKEIILFDSYQFMTEIYSAEKILQRKIDEQECIARMAQERKDICKSREDKISGLHLFESWTDRTNEYQRVIGGLLIHKIISENNVAYETELHNGGLMSTKNHSVSTSCSVSSTFIEMRFKDEQEG